MEAPQSWEKLPGPLKIRRSTPCLQPAGAAALAGPGRGMPSFSLWFRAAAVKKDGSLFGFQTGPRRGAGAAAAAAGRARVFAGAHFVPVDLFELFPVLRLVSDSKQQIFPQPAR